MDQPLASLVAANVAFVGSHFALSHPLRAPLVARFGAKGFMRLYTGVALATFAWIVLAFRAIGPGGELLWNGQAGWAWALGSGLTLLALVFLFGSFGGNPALPDTPAEKVAEAKPKGMLAVTRHPMMWGFALWAIAHILVSPNPRTLATAGAMGLLALVGAHLQDRKKEALLGPAWAQWEAQTSFWPRWSRIGGAGAGVWIAALAGWLALSWAHIWLANVPAGIWRWVG